MGARDVTQDAIIEAAEAVAEKIDVLLERATDAVTGAPRPGSPQWQQMWEARRTDAGRADLEHRTRIKIAIAEAAGVDPRHDIDRAHRDGLLAPASTPALPGDSAPPRSRRRRAPGAGPTRPESQQLAIW